MNALVLVTDLPLFAYGDVLDPTFTGRLLEHRVVAEPISLVDFKLLELPEMSTVLICEAPGENAPGRLYRHLSAADYERLDAYMGVAEGLHRRVVARVAGDGAEDPSATLEGAFVYVPTNRR